MSRYFWMYYLLGLCSFTSQQLLFPSGFESLLEGQTEQIEVLLPGHSLGLFPVVVKPDTVQFMSPLMVLESSGLAALPVAERQKRWLHSAVRCYVTAIWSVVSQKQKTAASVVTWQQIKRMLRLFLMRTTVSYLCFLTGTGCRMKNDVINAG